MIAYIASQRELSKMSLEKIFERRIEELKESLAGPVLHSRYRSIVNSSLILNQQLLLLVIEDQKKQKRYFRF
ncbi:hypothetical protein KAR91_82895 [Candidatus Pacearchaeota archaeon]|nr:hypothetical protein [Candidatus Pacearchaeota archaeon]